MAGTSSPIEGGEGVLGLLPFSARWDEMIRPNIRLEKEFQQFETLFIDRFPIRRRVNKGQVIYGPMDDRSGKCFYILSGQVSCTFIDDAGNERISTIRGEGTIFPLYYTFNATTIERTLEFIADETTVLIEIPKNDLVTLMEEMPAVALAMMDAYGEYTTYLIYGTEMQHSPLQQKVCSFLALHGGDYGVVRATHEQIAKSVGSTRENVTRILSKLQKQGIVSLSRGAVIVENPDKLNELIAYSASIGEQ